MFNVMRAGMFFFIKKKENEEVSWLLYCITTPCIKMILLAAIIIIIVFERITYTLIPLLKREEIFSVITISVFPYLLNVGSMEGPVNYEKKRNRLGERIWYPLQLLINIALILKFWILQLIECLQCIRLYCGSVV